jgi:hypothetical protein
MAASDASPDTPEAHRAGGEQLGDIIAVLKAGGEKDIIAVRKAGGEKDIIAVGNAGGAPSAYIIAVL